MKLRVLNSIPTTLALTLASTIIFSSASKAEKLTFFCGTVDGEPAIIAQTPQGNIPAIRWVSSDFQVLGVNSRSQCEQMAEKLQRDCAQPTGISQQRAVCTIIQAGNSSAGSSLNSDLGSDTSEQLAPLWGSDIQLSQSPEKSPIFPVYIQMNVFVNGFPPAATVPGEPNIFANPASGSSTKGKPDPQAPLW
ncbi:MULTISPECIES: COP23 domain-containing protein [unclassified Microcoleus]|uniref:COP23 domain-containing protein n=1 Tax=unclassified Microcoleus TaxID=2642155 RepID=UPI002FD04A29